MPSSETLYVVLASSISLDGAAYEQGDILTQSQLRGRASRLVQMGIIKPVSASEETEGASA